MFWAAEADRGMICVWLIVDLGSKQSMTLQTRYKLGIHPHKLLWHMCVHRAKASHKRPLCSTVLPYSEKRQ
jgi:hypothetical protein